MEKEFQNNLRQFQDKGAIASLNSISRGIEKESLRITPDGRLSQSPHPKELGSTLTHPAITTDYSEALLELITQPHQSIDAVLKQLTDTHQFIYQNIGHELLWVNSMPCILGGDLSIPIAQYGSSNIANMKTIYRHGLWHRYGRMMQAIAGIHFNFSFPDEFWQNYQQLSGNNDDFQSFKSEQYFKLIRNFKRFAWLPVYLFGASPAVCATFLKDQKHHLEPFRGSNTYHLPNATSLRMSDLGYQNDAQSDLFICYNSLDSYVECLDQAIKTPHKAYEEIGVKVDGEYKQLNANILQIENEYYGNIRPKRSAASNERPTQALKRRGVEYIEVRCIDLDPFSPIGIDETQIRFYDAFLLFCLFADNKDIDEQQLKETKENFETIVYQGRDPEARIIDHGESKNLREFSLELLDQIEEVSKLYDQANETKGETSNQTAVTNQRNKIREPELTPSGQILKILADEDISFFEFALEQAKEHRQYFKSLPKNPELFNNMDVLAEKSIADQKAIENSDEKDFDEFLADYFKD